MIVGVFRIEQLDWAVGHGQNVLQADERCTIGRARHMDGALGFVGVASGVW